MNLNQEWNDCIPSGIASEIEPVVGFARSISRLQVKYSCFYWGFKTILLYRTLMFITLFTPFGVRFGVRSHLKSFHHG
jgi:hypothetical protein